MICKVLSVHKEKKNVVKAMSTNSKTHATFLYTNQTLNITLSHKISLLAGLTHYEQIYCLLDTN